jgi:hypothetical protein
MFAKITNNQSHTLISRNDGPQKPRNCPASRASAFDMGGTVK